MGDFPIQTIDMEPMTIVGRVGVGAIDIRSIRPSLKARVTDPFVETVNEKVTRPATASPTAGPHRYTLVVPNKGENSVFSVGQADPKRINDTGITGETVSHIHLHTLGAAKPGATDPRTTMVAMGGGTTEGFVGYDGNKLAENKGFMMVTDGNSWLDARQQFYVVTREGELVLRALTHPVVIQSDTKSVDIGALTKVTIGTPGRITITADASGTLATAGYTKFWDSEKTPNWTWVGSKAQKHAITISDFVTSAAAWSATFKKFYKVNEVGKRGWTKEPASSLAKFLVDSAKLASTAIRWAHGTFWEPDGSVSISASQYASMGGSVAASVYGNLSASLTSLVSASVLGGTAGLKGLGWASVWGGLGVSIKSKKDADVAAEGGKLKLTAETDIDVASATGNVKIAAPKKATLTSDDLVYVTGEKRAVFVSKKHGVIATPDEVRIGEATSDDDGNAAAIVQDMGIKVGANEILAACKETSVHLTPDTLMIKGSSTVLIEGGTKVQVKAGSKILLG